jgi:hypothetical protein
VLDGVVHGESKGFPGVPTGAREALASPRQEHVAPSTVKFEGRERTPAGSASRSIYMGCHVARTVVICPGPAGGRKSLITSHHRYQGTSSWHLSMITADRRWLSGRKFQDAVMCSTSHDPGFRRPSCYRRDEKAKAQFSRYFPVAEGLYGEMLGVV